jgi:serine/threonine-protein kinase ULK/ATG1
MTAVFVELQHSSVIKLYDATLNETGKSLYVVMEFCEYGNLETFVYISMHSSSASLLRKSHRALRRETRDEVTEEVQKHLMREIAFGLEFLRSKSIVHRDLKLENVLVTKVHAPSRISSSGANGCH